MRGREVLTLSGCIVTVGGSLLIKIDKDSPPEDYLALAMAIHELLNRLPVTMRTKERRGVRIEGGRVIDCDYTGPVLEEAIRDCKVIKTIPKEGAYKGIPVLVVPVVKDGEAIAAIGVVDTTMGIFSDLETICRRKPSP
ncbi:MAG TPA: DUF2111 domain-containing protein [Candidatus Methanomethylia archaeon]|nr:DUF2111 domain-containing protein [Candidatus Methanomethylicia archaeon]